MIVGRIRTIDLASRLHGDEFAIFVQGTDDYGVAQRIMADINATLRKEAAAEHPGHHALCRGRGRPAGG